MLVVILALPWRYVCDRLVPAEIKQAASAASITGKDGQDGRKRKIAGIEG